MHDFEFISTTCRRKLISEFIQYFSEWKSLRMNIIFSFTIFYSAYAVDTDDDEDDSEKSKEHHNEGPLIIGQTPGLCVLC